MELIFAKGFKFGYFFVLCFARPLPAALAQTVGRPHILDNERISLQSARHMNESFHQAKMSFSDVEISRQLFGEHNHHLHKIAAALDIQIQARGNTIQLQGSDIAVQLAQNLLTQLYGLIKNRYPVYANDIDHAIKLLCADDKVQLKDIFLDTVYITAKKTAITPKNRTAETTETFLRFPLLLCSFVPSCLCLLCSIIVEESLQIDLFFCKTNPISRRVR